MGLAKRLEGKVAFISGGSRGLGAAIARLFTAEGARVALGDVLEEQGRRLADEIGETGSEALFVPLDVTRESDWRAAIESAIARFGRLDILVANAGVSAHSAVEDTSEEQWDWLMDINAKGVFLGMKTAIPEMQKAGGGSIVVMSSQFGIVGTDRSSPQYQASKGAVRILAKTAAIQYATDGIRVNSVHPGPIITPMTEKRLSDPEFHEAGLASIPLGRYGQPDDIAYGVLYLASDESSYVTGAELVIDGGWTAQ